jgi:hypothetical protein
LLAAYRSSQIRISRRNSNGQLADNPVGQRLLTIPVVVPSWQPARLGTQPFATPLRGPGNAEAERGGGSFLISLIDAFVVVFRGNPFGRSYRPVIIRSLIQKTVT